MLLCFYLTCHTRVRQDLECCHHPTNPSYSTALLGLLWRLLLMLTAEMPEVMEAAERGQAEACSPSEEIPDVITQVHHLPCQLCVLPPALARLG